MSLLDGQSLFEQNAFRNGLPLPDVIETGGNRTVTLQVRQVEQFLGLYAPDGTALDTTVWGYGTGRKVSYPGPTLVAYEHQDVTVNWQNKLPTTGHLLPVDPTIHMAESTAKPLAAGYVPLVSHLHGGRTSSAFDGLPDQWFTQSGGKPGVQGPRDTGPAFATSSFTYENDQQAATLWYHDHALGLTRLNVYAGLAGFYLLEDERRLALEASGVLPSGAQDIGLAIQDRAFTADGQLYYPAYRTDILPGQFHPDGSPMTVGDMVPATFYDTPGIGADAPSVVPEFFGDTILVNGMAWPTLNVAAGDYTFRLLNGSDSRFYVLRLDNPDVAVTLVGTDGGLLPRARTIIDGDGFQEDEEFLVLAPGDRVELVFDFGGLQSGDEVRLLNVGPDSSPFKGISPTGELYGDETVAATSTDGVGNILEFTVDGRLAPEHAAVQGGTLLNTAHVDLTGDLDANVVSDLATNVRHLGLFEGTDAYGRVTPMLGTAEAGYVRSDEHPDGGFGPLMYVDPVTETPLLGSVEDWMMFNFTADSHPVHLHLVQFQVVGKRHVDYLDEDEDGLPDDTNADGRITYGWGATDYGQADIWIGDAVDVRPEESGWQDTVQVSPHEMMSIVARFDRPGDYVWHCHILSHEDNEMMRPFTVVDPGGLVA